MIKTTPVIKGQLSIFHREWLSRVLDNDILWYGLRYEYWVDQLEVGYVFEFDKFGILIRKVQVDSSVLINYLGLLGHIITEVNNG